MSLAFYQSGGIIKDIGSHKNFEFSSTNPRKWRSLAIKYSIREEWIYPHFVLKSHFSRAFLTSIFLRTHVKARPTHGRAHIRERPAFHWHSASRGEFHLYANLKPRAHFCIPPWDPVETCPMQCTPVCAQPGAGRARREYLLRSDVSQKFSFVAKRWPNPMVQFASEIDRSI